MHKELSPIIWCGQPCKTKPVAAGIAGKCEAEEGGGSESKCVCVCVCVVCVCVCVCV